MSDQIPYAYFRPSPEEWRRLTDWGRRHMRADGVTPLLVDPPKHRHFPTPRGKKQLNNGKVPSAVGSDESFRGGKE